MKSKLPGEVGNVPETGLVKQKKECQEDKKIHAREEQIF